MIVYTLEQRCKQLRYYFENHCNDAVCVRKLRTDFERKESPSASYVRYLVKKVKETGILIDKPKREKPNNSAYTREYYNWGRKCAWSAININSLPFSTIEYFVDIIERILHKELGMTSYKVQLVQELKLIDHQMGFCFAKWATIDL